MTALLSKSIYCLICIWPMLGVGICWWLNRIIEGKTYYGALTPGVDPASPQGQQEFETRRQRNAEKRRNIYWTAGIIAAGYLAAFLWNTFTISAKASEPTPEPTQELSPTPGLTDTASPTLEQTGSPLPSLTLVETPTPAPTYAPTATNRVVYVAGPERTVVVTVVVERVLVVTATPTFTDTPTSTPTSTPTVTSTPTGEMNVLTGD